MKTRPAFFIRHPVLVLFLAGLITLAGSLLAAQLSVKADLSHLLPPSAKSVVDLQDVQRRTLAFGNLLVGIHADIPSAREAVARQLIERLRSLDPGLVAAVIVDDGNLRRYLWNHRY